jgi:two-component system, response regulator RegA
MLPMAALCDLRVLVVDDDPALLRSMALSLGPELRELKLCSDAAEAVALLRAWPADVVLLDVRLGGGSAFDVLDLARQLESVPAIIAMSGQATADESFRLAQLGVRAYLSKPFGADAARAEILRVTEQAADIRPHLRGLVGHQSVRAVEEEVRATMVREAMGRAKGSRSKAAGILRISRQLLQYMLRSMRFEK